MLYSSFPFGNFRPPACPGTTGIIHDNIYGLYIHIMIFTIFKQLLLAVMIHFFDSGYTKTIHPSYMFGTWQSIDSLP